MGGIGDESEKEELVGLLREQMKVEGELVSLYERTGDLIISGPIRRLLHTLQLDSMKHVDLCKAIIEVLQGDAITREEREELIVGLEHHMRLEEESIDRLNEISRNAWIREVPGLRDLVGKFRDEEREHHAFLRKLAGKRFVRDDPLDLFTAYRALAREKLRRELNRDG